MATSATAAIGTLLKVGDGAGSESFATIAEIIDIDLPEIGPDTVDVTNHDSPGTWAEHIATVLRAGQVQAKGNWIPGAATQTSVTNGAMYNAINKVKRNYKIVLTDTANYTINFAGFVKFKGTAHTTGAEEVSLTITVTGAVTITHS